MVRFASTLLLLTTSFCTAAVAQDFKFVEAKVLDENGKPMPAVSMEIKMDGIDFALSSDKYGMVSLNISNGNQPVSLRIRHEGYETQEKQWDRGIDVPVKYSFRMHPGMPTSGIVLGAADAPVAGAQIFYAAFDAELNFQNGRPAKKMKQRPVTSDAEGKFTLPFQPRGSTIACLCDEGWAQLVKSDKHKGALEIHLTPWAKVQLQSKLDEDLLSGGRLGLHYISKGAVGRGGVRGLGKERGNATWLYESETDAQGQLAFERVIPGTAMAYRTVTPRVARGKVAANYRSHGVISNLLAGQTHEVVIGGAERGARGKLYKPIRYAGTVDWDGGFAVLTENNPIEIGFRIAMFEYGKLLGQSGVMNPQKRVPPSGRANYLVRYLTVIEDDGTFVIENVPPGQYQLSAVLPAKPQGSSGNTDTLRLAEMPVSLQNPAEAEFFDLGEHILGSE